MVFEAIGMDATTQKREEDDAGLSPKEHFLFRGLLREKPEKDTEKFSGVQGKENRATVLQMLEEETLLRKLPTLLNPV